MRKLKNLFDAGLIRELGADFSRADPDFDAAGFVEWGLDGLEGLELTARAWHLAEALRKYLPQSFSRAADVLVASLGPEIPPTGENGLAPLRYMPHVCFVQKYGLDDFEAAMHAQYEITKRFSAEWSIRAFLLSSSGPATTTPTCGGSFPRGPGRACRGLPACERFRKTRAR
jgi:hypothetical protein